MTDGEIRQYLDEQRILNVATLGPSGHPHLVAMWYALIDGKVQFWTFAKSQKIVNLRRDPKMTGLVESGDSYNELKGVELVGNGRVIDDFDQIMRLGVELAVRYNGPAAASGEAKVFIEGQARKRLVVEFDVEQMVSWDHSKISGY
ncbi:PPOX class F420-dependent oxidoreductase [soil metagenome]